MKKKINIDIVSDVACPWCFVGKRRLEAALQELPDYEAVINWHPFQLDPTIPTIGADKAAYYQNKFGSTERYESLADNLVQAGKGANIDFDFKASPIIPNTLKMHQLIHVASEEGYGDALKEEFLTANFEEGVDLSKDESLHQIMSKFGWKKEKTQAVIDDQDIANYVKQEIGKYQQMGVSGVPFFIFNNKYAFSGAQPPQVFIDTIKDIEVKEAELVAAEACAIDDPNC